MKLLERMGARRERSKAEIRSYEKHRKTKKAEHGPVKFDVAFEAKRQRFEVEAYVVRSNPDDGSSWDMRVGEFSAARLHPTRIHCKPEVRALIDSGYGPWESRPEWGTLPKDLVFFQIKETEMVRPVYKGTTDKVGKQAYTRVIAAIKKAHPEGFFFATNSCGTGRTSEDARRVWASLAKRYPSRVYTFDGRENRGTPRQKRFRPLGTVLWIGPKPWTQRKRPRLAEDSPSLKSLLKLDRPDRHRKRAADRSSWSKEKRGKARAEFDAKLKKRPRFDWEIRWQGNYSVEVSGMSRSQDDYPEARLKAQQFPQADLERSCQEAISRLSANGYGEVKEGSHAGTPVYIVRNAYLDYEYEGGLLRGRGLGRLMYKKMIGALRRKHRRGFYFTQDACGWGSTSPDAKRVWDSLCRAYPCDSEAQIGLGRNVLYIGKRGKTILQKLGIEESRLEERNRSAHDAHVRSQRQHTAKFKADGLPDDWWDGERWPKDPKVRKELEKSWRSSRYQRVTMRVPGVKNDAGQTDADVGIVAVNTVSDRNWKCWKQIEKLQKRGFGDKSIPMYAVRNSWVLEKLRDHGLGSRLYMELIDNLKRKHPKGFYIAPHACAKSGHTSDKAARVWLGALSRAYPSADGVLYVGPK